MKKIFGWVALLVGMVTGANAQVNDTIQRTTGNDLYQGITRKLPYRQMVTPHGVQVTFAKTVHDISSFRGTLLFANDFILDDMTGRYLTLEAGPLS